jgi:hypothetical protein
MISQADIQNGIREVTSDDKSMSNIVAKVEENPEAFAKVLSEINMTQGATNKLKSVVASNPELEKKVSNMSSAEKKNIVKSMKKAQAMSNIVAVKGVRITQTNQIKAYNLKTGFPKNTIYDGEPYTIDNGNIVVFPTKCSQLKCKLASMLVGSDVFGEIVLVKQGNENQYDNFSTAECLEYKNKLTNEKKDMSK